jgi:maltooligosyltrehalose trehalohydrolase
MREAGDGWFELETHRVGGDAAYSFVLADGKAVNDPAARAQSGDVHGPSRLVDPRAYEWQAGGWKGRPLEQVVLYELHVGTFAADGAFDGVRRKLDHIAEAEFTAIELMPVSHFGGERGWGYDGTLLYAPHRCYGGPGGLKSLVDAAHERGLMMFLDVVYNHFGPEGNCLPLYAPDFFHPEDCTPWGAAIAYEKKPVRDFFVENALYWLEEYRFDGLRLDAIDHIAAQSGDLLGELASAVRARITDRQVHLMTEDDRNVTGLHERDEEGRPLFYSSEWNDDFHHAAHQIATGETIGYYSDYGDQPAEHLARALASGFIYQGEPSAYRDGQPRGESSSHLPPSAFVNFLQNHDQIGNRAYGERLTALAEPALVEALTAMLLLSPQVPLMFMGEEYGETNPFGFFTDFHGELAQAVREGRRREFAKWPHFASEEHSAKIADPNAPETFQAARLEWEKLERPEHEARLAFVKRLLALRKKEIVPLIPLIGANAGAFEMLAPRGFRVRWRTQDDRALMLLANLADADVALASAETRPDASSIVFSHAGDAEAGLDRNVLAPFAVVVAIEDAGFVPLPI